MRAELKRRNWGQVVAADKLKISKGMVFSYTSGGIYPPPAKIEWIAKQLGVDVSWLSGVKDTTEAVKETGLNIISEEATLGETMMRQLSEQWKKADPQSREMLERHVIYLWPKLSQRIINILKKTSSKQLERKTA